jgi:hypothetical protein
MSHTDQPITKLAEDELGLDNFIKQLALAITKYEHVSSFVVGLYGDWGSGKTSIINMLLDTLEQNKKENKIIVVKFNPWYFSGQDKLLEQFFDSLYINIKSNFEKIMGNSEKANKLSVSIGESTSGLIAYLKPLIKYIVPWVPGIPSQQLLSFLSTLEDFSKSLQGLKTDKKFDPIEKKKELNQKLKQLDRKVLIVMDDIDRLTKSEILQIFQLVKSVADFDNTIYLLSFSPDVVTQSLEGIQGGEGRKYLEKIVQYPIEIPSIERKYLEDYICKEVDKIVEIKNIDSNLYSQTRFRHLFYNYNFRFYFDNLREVKRFLNIFQFDFDLIGNEVNIVDLIFISAVKSLDTYLYNFIRNNKELFVGGKDSAHYKSREISKEVVANNSLHGEADKNKEEEKVYQNIPKISRKFDLIDQPLKFMFPFLKRTDMPIYSSATLDNLFRGIGDLEYFDYYFQLNLPDNKISQQIVSKLISLKEKPEEFIEEIKIYINTNKFESLFSEILNFYKFELFNMRNENILIKHIRNFSSIISLVNVNQIYESDSFNSIHWVLTLIENFIDNYAKLDFSEHDVRKLLIIEHLLNDDDSIIVSLHFLDEFAEYFGLYKNNQRNISEIDNFKYSKEFKNIENQILSQIEELAKSDKLAKHRNFRSIIRFWKMFDEKAEQKYMNNLLKDNKKIAVFLNRGLYPKTIDNKLKYDFDIEYLKKFVSLDKIEEILINLKNNENDFTLFASEEQFVINLFLEKIDDKH